MVPRSERSAEAEQVPGSPPAVLRPDSRRPLPELWALGARERRRSQRLVQSETTRRTAELRAATPTQAAEPQVQEARLSVTMGVLVAGLEPPPTRPPQVALQGRAADSILSTRWVREARQVQRERLLLMGPTVRHRGMTSCVEQVAAGEEQV